MDTKYIFVTGGVVSSLGKGIISASIGKLLQARGYKVTIQKFDPYINIDPGTLNPYEHGECYVTEDGFETDLDLGHYERFTGIHTTRNNSITTGRIYKTVIDRERHGDYLGKTIQVVPHITDEIKRRMLRQSEELRVKRFPLSRLPVAFEEFAAAQPMTQSDSSLFTLHSSLTISERHRHRYEFNNAYKDEYESNGMKCVGINPKADLVEIVEIPEKKWYIGTQFHPEYSSTVLHPHPLFMSFIKACIWKS